VSCLPPNAVATAQLPSLSLTPVAVADAAPVAVTACAAMRV